MLDGGYLSSAAAEFKSVFPFTSINQIPCLALLGEPGIGKSNAVRDSLNSLRAELGANAENSVLALDLSPFGNENRLIQELFESEKFKAWVDGSHSVSLFLDSLDEGLLRIDTLAALLATELEKYPINRLNLRIACRTAEWPPFLEQRLKKLWGEDQFKAYELAPLRAADVRGAALSEGIDAGEFLAEVDLKEASPLAAKPVTLRLLFNLYKKELRLPKTQSELYERGCLSLCEEPSDTRKTAKKIGKLTAAQRLRLAGRIAAITIFSNKANIWTGNDTGEQLESDVMVHEIAGGFERNLDGTEFHVTEQAVRETYSISGLFTARGVNRLGWAHQTFAEFLASWYLDYSNLDDNVLLGLLKHSNDQGSMIVPQLYETAAWSASKRPSLFRQLISLEPLVLLRSDVLAAGEKTRADLVAALLEIFANEQELDAWGTRHNYRKLYHSGLVAQLRSYIKNQEQGFLVRRVAIDIAEECQLTELNEELADIALDQREPIHTRKEAAVAVSRIKGDPLTKARMKPLALSQAGDDPDLELKGYGLICVWPEHMIADDLFDCLVTPREGFYGGYQSFLSNNLVPNLRVKDLPIALAWAERELHAGRVSYSLENVLDDILVRAWAYLEQPQILSPFARVAIKRIKHHDDVLSRDKGELLAMRQDFAKREQLLRYILPTLTTPVDLYLLGSSKLLSLQKDDVGWLIEEFIDAVDPQLQQTIVLILNEFMRAWSGTDPDVLNKVHAACEKDDTFRSQFGAVFEPVMLDSPTAQQMRESFEHLYDSRKKKRDEVEDQVLTPSPAERVLSQLDKFEKGDIDAWWRLNLEMTLESESRYYGSELEPDLTNLPGWKQASDETHVRIVAGAKAYLLSGNPQTDKWLGTNIIHRPAFAGYRALYLLSQTDPRFFDTLPPGVWQKWAGIVFHYPVLNGIGEETFNKHRSFIATAYHHDPDGVTGLLLAEIDHAKSDEGFFSLEKLQYCWDSPLKVALRNKLTDPTLPGRLMNTLLDKLLELGDLEAETFAHSLLLLPLPSDGTAREAARVAARSLLQYGASAGWESVWPAITSDAEFGRQVVESIALSWEGQNVFKLHEDQIANLYLWLSKQYPHEEDVSGVGMHFVGTREEIANWRNSLLSHLKGRGTPEAVNAIKRIVAELSNLEWLKWILIEAKKNMRQQTWKPLLPSQVLELTTLRKKSSNSTANGVRLNVEIPIKLWNRTIDTIPNLEELSRSYKAAPDSFAFLVGAGLSLPLFPLWDELLKRMVAYCYGKEKLSSQDKEELLGMLAGKKDYSYVASACVDVLELHEYRQFIEREFDKNFTIEEISFAYRALFELRPNTIITTNFDQIPDRLANTSAAIDLLPSSIGTRSYTVFTNRTTPEAGNAWKKKEPIVFKMHGCSKDQESIVLTLENFQDVLSERRVRGFLDGVFKAQTVIFLGFSFSDPHIDSILSLLAEANANIGSPHYVLTDSLAKHQRRLWEKKYGVTVLNYEPSNSEHPEVPEFIRFLKSFH
jgi:predicted NACHT family NTPase